MNLIRPYIKIVDLVNDYACVAIYEPNPFRSEALCEAVKQSDKKPGKRINLGDDNIDDQWCWVYYDWCYNPVGISKDAPEGRLTYKLVPEDFEWMGYDNAIRYCECLNREPNVEMKREWEKKYEELVKKNKENKKMGKWEKLKNKNFWICFEWVLKL